MQGRTMEARTKLEEVLAQSPDGPFADDALMALADLDAPGLGPDRWGQASRPSLARSRARLERLIAAFPDSELTALAAYRLGVLLMHPLDPKGSLDRAYEVFEERRNARSGCGGTSALRLRPCRCCRRARASPPRTLLC